MENNEKQISKEFLTRLKGNYQAKYGFEMDEWTSIILYEMSERFTLFNQVVETSKTSVDKATEQIKGQVSPIHFSSEKQAFKYGLGQTIGWAVPFCIALMLIVSLIFWTRTTTDEYESKIAIINRYKHIKDFEILAANAEIIQKNECNFLVLKPNPKGGDIIIGKEYIYKSKQNEIWVPLGR